MTEPTEWRDTVERGGVEPGGRPTFEQEAGDEEVRACLLWVRNVLRQAFIDAWSDSDRARVTAERVLVETSLYLDDAGNQDAWTIQMVAWGRRFDAPGWREEWAPDGVERDFLPAARR